MSRRHGPVLAALTLLFGLRVFGQALVAFFSVTWLPSMEQWHSGLIRYPVLFAIQLAMLIVMSKLSMDVCRGRGFFAKQRPSWSRFLVSFSAIYAGAMALRYILTMLYRPELRWFGNAIPIFFHFVLAGFILTLGHYNTKTESPCALSGPSS